MTQTYKTVKSAGPDAPAPQSEAVRDGDPAGTPEVRPVLGALEDVKGQDLRVLDVRSLTTITDYMVFCTGTSNRHVKSLAARVIDDLKALGRRPHGVEGMDQGEWVLVDTGDVIVHVMQAQTRAHYALEKLWDVAMPGEGSAGN